MLRCLFCPFTTANLKELLEHEDREHTPLVEALDDVDGNEDEEEITGEEPEED